MRPSTSINLTTVTTGFASAYMKREKERHALNSTELVKFYPVGNQHPHLITIRKSENENNSIL